MQALREEEARKLKEEMDRIQEYARTKQEEEDEIKQAVENRFQFCFLFHVSVSLTPSLVEKIKFVFVFPVFPTIMPADMVLDVFFVV